MRRSLLTSTLAFALIAVPSSAGAATGGAGLPGSGGGTKVGQAAPEPVPEPSRAPLLRSFSASASRVRFRIDAPTRRVRVRIALRRPGSRRTVMSVALGSRRTRRAQRATLDTTGLAPGRYVVGISARRLRRSRGVRATRVITVKAPSPAPRAPTGHRFPLIGPFTYGGAGARFGAGRPGHIHQGQDVIAPAGTPIVAPYGGTVKTVAYQAGGAGNYVVLHSDRDYVFMHLTTGSTRVRVGQKVSTGQRIGDVGATGDASGPHLHFEVWVGGWFSGGHPIDPLPLLRSWER